ncbi:MBL fold metallo-hydrolase [Natronoarchaeum mannanilyticum]|uniref:MBL fold metallo-hydrolase n=1 Tax=Natronoarchaeum mannanilyticum TaxID=926360 RepID=A0AAV3T698_9EURY
MDVVTVTADAESFTCNAYLALGERDVLVDAGAMPGVEDVVAEHTDSLDAVVLTHQHGDHVQELDAVLDAFGAELYAYADHPRRTHEIADGDEVAIGDESFDVVHTPGHADDHVSLLSESTIFSGDVVVHDDGAFDYGSFGRTDMAGQSREVLIESIERILERLPDSVSASEASAGSSDRRSDGVEHMYAGHGDEFHGDVEDVIRTALERAEKREPKYPDE